MIFVTGDTHGVIKRRISKKNWAQAKQLNRNDVLIVAGDCGLIWDLCPSASERDDIRWLDTEAPYTFAFIDGNHENFERLNSYPIDKWNGGRIHRISDNVIHLMRGEIYDVPDGDGTKRIFTCGGAKSQDIAWRRLGIDWWEEEVPSWEECGYCVDQLESVGWNVDYIITHDCPSNILYQIDQHYMCDGVNMLLDEIYARTDFKKWVFGHHHMNMIFNGGEFECLYGNIIQLQ